MFNRPQTIKQLYFAVPEPLLDLCIEVAPPMAGIVAVKKWDREGPFMCYHGQVKIVRPPAVNKMARSLTPSEVSNAQRLAAMRIWSLKEKLLKAVKGNG